MVACLRLAKTFGVAPFATNHAHRGSMSSHDHFQSYVHFYLAKNVQKSLAVTPEFPKAGEVKKIETRTGGPAPGIKVDGELTTTVEKSTENNTYIVTLTKAWNQKVNDKEAKSVWTYEVTQDKAELISSEENADLINLIK